MAVRLLLALVVAVGLAGCMPSADLRVPNPDGSIQPGRLVIVPVQAASDSVPVTDWSYSTGEFDGAADHDGTFWTALTFAVQAELEWSDVSLHAPVPDTGFVDLRVRRQGKRDLWVVRTLSVPASIDYEAYDADHVLFVRNAEIDIQWRRSDDDPAGDSKRMLAVSADVAWMDATREVPVVLEDFVGSGAMRGGATMSEVFNRESWSDAVEGLAQRVARRATAQPLGGRFRLF